MFEVSNSTEEVEKTCTVGIDNIGIVRADRGGFGAAGPVVALDGSAVSEVTAGDANLDGKVDLVDLVRAKKYMVNKAANVSMTSPISIVSVDADATGAIDANDITAIINKILGVVA